MRIAKAKGFTLLEILVALAVLAVTLTAATRAIGVSLQSAQQIKLGLLADWVAQNRLASHRLSRNWPGVGTSSGTETQGGVAFAWEEQVSSTPHALFRRVDVRVVATPDNQHELRHLIAYVARPS